MNVYLAIPLIPTLLQFIFIFKAPNNLLLNHFDESTMCFCRLRSCILWQKFTEMTLSLSVYSVNDFLWVKCSCHTLLAHSEQDKCYLVASVKAVLDLPLTLLVFLLFTCLSDTRMNSLPSDICFKHFTLTKKLSESIFKQNAVLSTLYYILHITIFTVENKAQASDWDVNLYQCEWGFIEYY